MSGYIKIAQEMEIKTQKLKKKKKSYKNKGKRDLRKHMMGIFKLSAFKVINWAMSFQTDVVSSIFSINKV